eukprot:406896-Rhodomonas_salina.1
MGFLLIPCDGCLQRAHPALLPFSSRPASPGSNLGGGRRPDVVEPVSKQNLGLYCTTTVSEPETVVVARGRCSRGQQRLMMGTLTLILILVIAILPYPPTFIFWASPWALRYAP